MFDENTIKFCIPGGRVIVVETAFTFPHHVFDARFGEYPVSTSTDKPVATDHPVP